jgi:FkbM family methyltransferase
MNLHKLVGKKTYIYGTGKFASRIKEVLEKENIEVLAFLELNKEISTFEQLPVINSSHFEKLDKIFPVIVGLGNPQADIQVVTSSLGESCFRIINPIQFAVSAYESGHRFENYWLTGDLSIYGDHKQEIEVAKSLLSDEKSKNIFESIIQYRKTGEVLLLPERYEVKFQYLAPDLPWNEILNEELHVLDGGAFDGDTYDNFTSAGTQIGSWIFIEPDQVNFSKIISKYKTPHHENYFIQAALSSRNGTARFESTSDLNNGSRMHSDGGDSTTLITIDSIDLKVGTNFIKLDIEGEELNALKGASETIAKYRPVLAISTYHLPEHHWEILTFIDSLGFNYKFYLRVHGEQTFDAVLYGFPSL